jgi:hypothetical protein
VRVYEQAIIIDEPWLSKILAGNKAWEMRSRPTNIRGPIGLILKRSGAAWGAASLVGSLPALSMSDFASDQGRHGIPASHQKQAFKLGRRVPWVLENARALSRPVPYRHRSGQQIWVRLDSDVDQAIQAALTS